MPDWTNQAKLVDRGAADIVINRDSVMEQGRLPSNNNRAMDSGTLVPQSELSGSDAGEGNLETEKNGESDQGETMMEWREPHHTVIERLHGPGEEVVFPPIYLHMPCADVYLTQVEVEVVDSENRPETPGLSAKIRQSLKLLEGLKKSAGHLEDHAGRPVEHRIAEIETHIQDALSADQHLRDDNAGDDSKFRKDVSVINLDEDDEGWASDRSRTSQGVVAKRRLKAPKMKQSASSSSKSHQVGSSTRKGRSRTSLRRGQSSSHLILDPEHIDKPQDNVSVHPTPSSPSTNAPTPASSTATTEVGATKSRGRSYPYLAPRHRSISPSGSSPSHSRPSTAEKVRPGTGDSASHQRLEHLRMMHSSPPTRDVSPSRSVRFMDEAANRATTPPPLPPLGSPPGYDEDGAYGNKVTFEIPVKSPTGGKA